MSGGNRRPCGAKHLCGLFSLSRADGSKESRMMEPKNISLTAQMEIEAAEGDPSTGSGQGGPPYTNARRGLLTRRANVDDNPRGCFAALHKPRHRSTTPKSRDAKYASPGDALRGLCFFRCLGGQACPPYDLLCARTAARRGGGCAKKCRFSFPGTAGPYEYRWARKTAPARA